MSLIFGILALVLAKVMGCSGEELISLSIVIATFEISNSIDSLRIRVEVLKKLQEGENNV